MKKTVKINKLRVRQDKRYGDGKESSPYWDNHFLYARGNEGEEKLEPVEANPDILSEAEVDAPSTPQLLMGEAIEHLQGRQKEVYLLSMREGKSFSEIAEILGIARSTVQKFRERAVKFISDYCNQAIKQGRV